MAVNSCERDGVIRRAAAERGVVREGFFRPIVLVPSPPSDPFPFRQGLGLGGDGVDDLLIVFRADEIEAEQAQAEIYQMAVGVDESRDDRFAVQVDDTRARARTRENVLGRSDCSYPSAGDGDGLRGGLVLVEGVDGAIDKHQVGRGLRGYARSGRHENRDSAESDKKLLHCPHPRSCVKIDPSRRGSLARSLAPHSGTFNDAYQAFKGSGSDSFSPETTA